MKKWHSMPIPEIESSLKTDINNGLSEDDAGNRIKTYGPNELREKKSRSIFMMLLEQFTDFMVIILIIAAAISFFIGEAKDSIVILVIVMMNAVLGVVQEERAARAVQALKKLTIPKVMVKRGGVVKKISSKELVPGDYIFLETGGFVSADARIIEAVNLKIDEASLTGESFASEKTADTMESDVSLADRRNMAYMGTMVTYGRGMAIVTGTGMGTELGKIAEMVQTDGDVKTPLQKRLNVFGKWLGLIALFICFIVFVAGTIREGQIFEMFLTAVSLAVAAIPEGLPAVVTISLALGAYRMVRRHAIIRKLPAVETLGSVSHICSDKTGTLTQNKMTVNTVYFNGRSINITGIGYDPDGKFLESGKAIYPANDKVLNEILVAGLLCNDAYLERFNDTGSYGVIGDPTEGALVVAAAKAGIKKMDIEKEMPRVGEIPFDSKRKIMFTVHKKPSGGMVVYIKGAPGEVLNISGISRDESEKIINENDKLTSKGLRTLAVAKKEIGSSLDYKEIEKDVTFLGIVAMMDLPRPEVKDSVKLCMQAGIRPIMITGDHMLTAFAVAKELGIASSKEEVMLGQQLEGKTPDELKDIVKRIKVFARVSPENKLSIVEAVQANGGVVAVTGDGVNDAPALKKADIGVAMGITGTDVSKEASDMILTDDNFATIVSAVEEGRGIFENIRKFIWYLLSANSGEILTMFFSIIIGMPLPLIPIQILWINLVTDGLPALALSMEPIESGVMNRPPRKKSEGVLDNNIFFSIVLVGTVMAISVLLIFSFGLAESIIKARTLAFTMLAALEMVHVINCRSERGSIFKVRFFSNIYLLLAIFSTLLLQAMVVYMPFFQTIFGTVSLNLKEIGMIFVFSLPPLVVVELQKLFTRKIMY